MSTSLQVEETDVADEAVAPAALPDLPNELLLLIIEDLDNEALLNLGLTCRQMNLIALNHFFLMNDVRDPRGGWFCAYQNPSLPDETLTVLRSALFIKHLTYFEFALNSGIERMRSEVSNIHLLAARLHAMDVFKISLHRIDLDLFAPSVQDNLPMEPWYRSVTKMLETVLEQGCIELHVEGGSRIFKLYSDHTPRQVPPESTQSEVNVVPRPGNAKKERHFIRPRLLFNSFRRICSLQRKRQPKAYQTIGYDDNALASVVDTAKENLEKLQITNKALDRGNSLSAPLSQTQPALSSSRKFQLREVYIHSEMLLHHPFSNWTLFTLNTASSTITKLSFKLTVKASSTWKIFSAAIFLPLLRVFSFTNDFFSSSDVAEFVDMEDFLANHPRINHLYMYGVGLPPSEAVPRPSFQHLTTFNAHPLYIVWLMKRLVSGTNILPSLQRIVISSENYKYPRKPDFDYSLFDLALEAIAPFPKHIVIAITFNRRPHIEDWFRSHVQAGVEQSVITRLVHVKTFSIYDTWTEYTQAMITIIPEWLQLFPALKHFKFEKEAEINVKNLIEPQYVATISVLCRKLETMDVNQHTFDLQVVRRNLGGGADD